MQFNVTFVIDAADEIEAMEAITDSWVVPGGTLTMIVSSQPITVQYEQLPVVDEGGNIRQRTSSDAPFSAPFSAPPKPPDQG